MSRAAVLIVAPFALFATVFGPTWLWLLSAPLAVAALAIALRRLTRALERSS